MGVITRSRFSKLVVRVEPEHNNDIVRYYVDDFLNGRKSVAYAYITHHKRTGHIWLAYIGVDDDLKGKGYGSWLMEQLLTIHFPKLKPVRAIELLDIHEGKTFYTRWGFKLVEGSTNREMVLTLV